MNILHKLKFFIITILTFFNISIFYGENSKVAIITFEPGNELYTIFGHTALRIQDSALNIDNIYNFGTFDFSSPFFYIKFFGGKLDYFLTILEYRTFLYCASIEKRTIYEQTLDLTKAERDYLYNRLEQIYHSKERFYRYDLFNRIDFNPDYRENRYAGFSSTFIPWISIIIVMYVVDMQINKRIETNAAKRS